MRPITVFAAFVLVIVGVAACSGPTRSVVPADEYLTAEEAAVEIRAIRNDLVAVGEGLASGVLGRAFEMPFGDWDGPLFVGMPSLAVGLLHADDWDAPPRLATGTYDFDPDTETWTYEATPSDGLVVRWAADDVAGTTTELAIDWTHGGSPTVEVTDWDGSTFQLPTRARLLVTHGTTTVVDMALEQALRTTSCGTIAEATLLRLNGTAGNAAAGVTVTNLTLQAATDTRYTLTGGVAATSGSLTLGLDLDLAATISLSRDPTTCFPELDALDAASVKVKLERPTKDVDVTFELDSATGASGATFTLRAGRVLIGTGRFDVGGTFDGTSEFDEALRLTFANAQVLTLRGFIETFDLLD
jgi:hypothetical protein